MKIWVLSIYKFSDKFIMKEIEHYLLHTIHLSEK
jgi:hypothetical protein